MKKYMIAFLFCVLLCLSSCQSTKDLPEISYDNPDSWLSFTLNDTTYIFCGFPPGGLTSGWSKNNVIAYMEQDDIVTEIREISDQSPDDFLWAVEKNLMGSSLIYRASHVTDIPCEYITGFFGVESQEIDVSTGSYKLFARSSDPALAGDEIEEIEWNDEFCHIYELCSYASEDWIVLIPDTAPEDVYIFKADHVTSISVDLMDQLEY